MSVALEVGSLTVRYGDVDAVRAADLTVEAGEVAALIGESGSGKTSLALAAGRLLPLGTAVEGRVTVDGRDYLSLAGPELRRWRGRRVGYVPQDAMAALNPVLSVGRQLAEVFELHEEIDRRAAFGRASAALASVRIHEPERVMRLYPHQLSGGMRQRVLIAMAMALSPAVLIADEPTTALDVSVQAEILALVRDLCRRSETGVLWITHDMGVVAEIADSIAVMYAGRIVERGAATPIFDHPRHPYTAALISTRADLRRGAAGDPLFQIDGQPPSPGAPIPGCRFNPRCVNCQRRCTSEDPPLVAEGEQAYACHFPLAGAAIGAPA